MCIFKFRSHILGQRRSEQKRAQSFARAGYLKHWKNQADMSIPSGPSSSQEAH